MERLLTCTAPRLPITSPAAVQAPKRPAMVPRIFPILQHIPSCQVRAFPLSTQDQSRPFLSSLSHEKYSLHLVVDPYARRHQPAVHLPLQAHRQPCFTPHEAPISHANSSSPCTLPSPPSWHRDKLQLAFPLTRPIRCTTTGQLL